MFGRARKGREQRGVGEIAEKKIVRAERMVKFRQVVQRSSEANTIVEGGGAKERDDGKVRWKSAWEKNTENDNEKTLRGS